ncbi:DUF2231 domain-containing protein [Flavobacterium taihuense]|uniref:DUF2231 domain-containing protein n=1 Tax=Flavobacterium taihuense TaxID=2857508 RepID=A0ABS6XUT8_9FLAO|nr:DUF2231 domain-containing protein [Flavobacterium taihuense]MBW4360443.1 hypothetical protein [Flavobacterium taihuense]
MNDAHLHMVVNHFPIIGTIFGFGILIAGLVLKNKTLQNTSYILFIVAAIFAAFSMGTGEGAEELVEDMPNIGKQIIHEHEELAEKLAILLYVLGALSLVGLYLNFKNYAKAKLLSFLILGIATAGLFLVQKVGTSGGEIRHTEIRANASTLNSKGAEKTTTVEEDKEDND